ncbi:helix-turn-helix transcriptional regulator [uncultured Campylobacter sp.]|uniref:helix-turn-helix domain-containing protein n=1 Tax=uncultured Campylobacter sp. TaxID=218934 RepID=UPI00262712E3|nr:helix-turn-helix transcriptional regulator [uncultured Campylobacter sp.]
MSKYVKITEDMIKEAFKEKSISAFNAGVISEAIHIANEKYNKQDIRTREILDFLATIKDEFWELENKMPPKQIWDMLAKKILEYLKNSVIVLGYDVVNQEKAVAYGRVARRIKLDTDPLYSNYYLIEEELKNKISSIVGYLVKPSSPQGADRYIYFADNDGELLYVLEWHFDADYGKEQNIVKRVCKELGITQRELAERMDIPESTVARWKGGDLPRLAELYLNALLENIELKSKLETIKKAHEIVSNL